MKIFRFFITKIFLKKALIVVGVLILLFLSNYLVFTAARATVSTLQGYEEVERLYQPGSYIFNLDPDSSMNMREIDKKDTQTVYDYLNENFSYSLFTDGFIVSLPNAYDMEVSFAYINEEYYKLTEQFEISQGEALNFDYYFDDENIEIPVLVGKGLSKTYPLGSTIEVEDPALLKQVTLKVQGILEPNVYHSNLYLLNSKQYYNFSVIVPVTDEFIANSTVGLQINGIFDLILLQTSESEIEELHNILLDNLGLKFNFRTPEDNYEYFNEYYFGSLKIISAATTVVLLILTCLTIWSSLAGIRTMIKEFTINLFVGLSYSKLRKIFYGYYGMLYLAILAVLFIITAYSRRIPWINKDASFCTFGVFGMIEMDWLGLLAVLIFDIIIGVIIVEISMWRIKKVPISLGVLQ